MTCNASDPWVSVIIPVYNAEDYIERCLDSVLSQSYANVEAICVDDGSLDASAAILDRYAETHPERIRVKHQKNAGAAAARNAGIALAHGEYLTFMDNDDWIDRDFVERLIDASRASGSDVVCSGYRRPDEAGDIVLEATTKPGDEWAPYVAQAAWAKLYRTDFVRQHKLAFLGTNILEDLYFSLPAIELASKVEIIDYCGYNWFWNTQSVSNTKQRTSDGLQFEQTLNELLAMMVEKGIELTPILVHYFVRLVTWFLLFTRKGDGAQVSSANLAYYTAWLDGSVPGWRRDRFAGIAHPTGDSAANRMAVYLFVKHPRIFACALRCYGSVG